MKAKGNTNLEEYLDFFVNPEQISLSIKQLNQVVHMQGFKKIHKTTKVSSVGTLSIFIDLSRIDRVSIRSQKTMCDALSTVDLTVPFRSTLSDGASPSSVAVTVQEVASDLAELKWSECSVRSVLELRSPSKENLNLNLNLNMNMNTSRNDQPPNSFSGKRATGKRSKIPKKRKVSSILEIESDPSTTHHHHPCFSC
ncbi:hypothetical protein Scep_011610 [Stephania cephalantha]|uniref:DUF7787 domain-containing protein n=1 Tax=Stephania cephalantha TaxID=152367 RepID=A0AAP0P5Q7_9MAGN